MEKRNVTEEKRTPCRKIAGTFCECDACTANAKALQKQGSAMEAQPCSIYDVEAMAKAHK